MASVYQLLQFLPERREAGRGVEELIEEIGVDFVYLRKRTARRLSRDDHWSLLPHADWLAWRSPSTLTELAEIYREHFSGEFIAGLVSRPHPLFAAIGRSRPHPLFAAIGRSLVPTQHHPLLRVADDDGIEMRVRSYANVIQATPRAIIPDDGDE